MYEHLRNDFLRAAHNAHLSEEAISVVSSLLDSVAGSYEIKRKEVSLVPYNNELPEIAKTYLVCKKIEGLSELTLGAYLRTLTLFFSTTKKPIDKITTNDVRLYLYTYQKERGSANQSLDKYRSYLAGFFKWATDEGYIERNPMRTIPPIKSEKKTRENLTQLELEYLRECCQTSRERAIIEFLYSTGCRVSELVSVKKSDLNWEDNSVHLFGKGAKHRTSFINAKSEVSLQAYLQTRTDDCEFLFVTERKPYRQLKTDAIEKIVRNIANRSGEKIQKNVTPHILRHTTATTALQSGMPISDICKLLGHEKIETTMIYAKTSMEDIRAGHRKYIT